MNSYFDTFGEDYIASMDDSIRDTKVKPTNGYTMPPDGKYQMRVHSLQVKESNSPSGYPNFIIQLIIMDGEHKNTSVYKRYSLEPNPSRIRMLKSDLFLLGVDLHSIRDLENESLMSGILDQIIDARIKSSVSQSNGKSYANIYFNRLVGKAGAQFSSYDNDDLPWGKR